MFESRKNSPSSFSADTTTNFILTLQIGETSRRGPGFFADYVTTFSRTASECPLFYSSALSHSFDFRARLRNLVEDDTRPDGPFILSDPPEYD